MRLAPQIVTLEIGGHLFSSFRAVSYEASLDRPCRSFSVDAFQQRAGQVVCRPGAACVLSVNGVPVVTGWADAVDVSMETGGSTVGITGRSRTCDLVDCHPTPETLRRWRSTPPLAIAAAIAAPYGVVVTSTAGPALAPLARFALEDHATCWDAIDRLCNAAGLLAVDDALGNLELLRLSEVTALRHTGGLASGVNLMSWRVHHDMAQRFSTYRARGQTAADLATPPALAASVVGLAVDSDAPRTRHLDIDAHGLDTAAAMARAEWEAATRYGRAVTVMGTVPGWTDAAGVVWAPGRMVAVVIPEAALATELMITEVALTHDAQAGTRASLTLQPPEAFAAWVAPVRKRGRRAYDAPLVDVQAAIRLAESAR